MAMKITGVDNLVQRLIQQGARERSPTVRANAGSGRDRVNVSPEARQSDKAAAAAKVEAKLLQLYGPRKT